MWDRAALARLSATEQCRILQRMLFGTPHVGVTSVVRRIEHTINNSDGGFVVVLRSMFCKSDLNAGSGSKTYWSRVL
jgi:hypothetical protein